MGVQTFTNLKKKMKIEQFWSKKGVSEGKKKEVFFLKFWPKIHMYQK